MHTRWSQKCWRYEGFKSKSQFSCFEVAHIEANNNLFLISLGAMSFWTPILDALSALNF